MRKGIFGFFALLGASMALACASFCLKDAKFGVLAEGEEEISSEEVIASEEIEEISSETIEEVITSEEIASEEPVLPCFVEIAKAKNGTISVDKEFGEIGDVVIVTAKHDALYLTKSVTVNGVSLIESEETSGEFSFALVEGRNLIEAKFEIDEALLGELGVIIDQAKNGDWTNLFSVETVVRIIGILMNGGFLIAIARYFIKDKKLADKVENAVKKTVEKIVPQSTQEAVIANAKEVISPMFSQMVAYQSELRDAFGVLAKCMALMQEDTPESRIAILNELSNLKIGDGKTIEDAKKVIEDFIKEKFEGFESLMEQLNEIIAKAEEVTESKEIEQEKEETKEIEPKEIENEDNGSRI